MKIFFYLSPILFLLLFHEVSAQKNRNNRTGIISSWEIGVSGGAATFLSSINPERGATASKINFWNREVNPGFGLSVVRNFSPSLGIEMNLLSTRLTGNWKGDETAIAVSVLKETPTTFNSQINQFDLMITFNVNQIWLPGEEEDLWHLFFKTGVGLTQIKDHMNFFPGDSPCIKPSIAIDAGISFSLNEQLKLKAGSTFRAVNTDNLDGVHFGTADLNGNTVSNMKVFEIYNYTYLCMSYSLGHFGSKKYNGKFRKKSGRSGSYRRR